MSKNLSLIQPFKDLISFIRLTPRKEDARFASPPKIGFSFVRLFESKNKTENRKSSEFDHNYRSKGTGKA